MFEVGNLRIKMSNGFVWATQQQMFEPDISSFNIIYPFNKETEIKSLTDCKYEINYYNGSTETNDYVGGLIGCSDIVFNLQDSWLIEFEYMFTGDINSKGDVGVGNIAEDWNAIFGFGQHINSPSYTENISYYLPLTESTIANHNLFCNPPANIIGYHSYAIKYYNGVTTVTIDNIKQATNQYDYPSEVQGFYLSGGGSYHSIPCRIKNLKISASIL